MAVRWLFAGLCVYGLVVGPGTAGANMPLAPQRFQIGAYTALSLIGEPALLPDVRYVSFTGDFGFREWVPSQEVLDQHIAHETDLLAHFDLNVINLEFMLPTEALAASPDKGHVMLDFLERAGFDLVARANNHAMDAGPAGVADNTRRLEEAGFATLGVRSRPWYEWNADGKSIAIYGVARGTDEPDAEHHVLTIERDLEWLARETAHADFRIAFVHLGSMSTYLSPHEREQAQQIVAHGADLVVCTGSHFVKGFVREADVPVAYGIGNHIFSYADAATEPTGMHFVAGFRNGELHQAFAIPFANTVRDARTGPLGGEQLDTFVAALVERSTTDTSRYYSDPHAMSSFRRVLAQPRLSHLKTVRPRHFAYALRILWDQYPVATIVGCVAVVALLVGGVGLWRRARRRRATAHAVLLKRAATG